jgi:hypothetical protein
VLLVAAGLAVGVLLAALVFFRVEWRGAPSIAPRFGAATFFRRLPEHARWLAPFVLAVACLPALRAVAWRAAFPPPRPTVAEAYHATALGALLHNTVPGKMGPLAAAWLLARTAGRPLGATLSTQLLAKLLELGSTVALGATAAALADAGGAVRRAVLGGAAAFAVLATAAVAVALGAPRAAERLARRLPRVAAALAALGEGIRAAGTPGRLGAVAALALLPAAVSTIAYALPVRALGLGPALAGGAIVLAVITFGQFTPGLPVGTGVYWSLAAWAARELGASAPDAAAMAVLTHAGMVATTVVVGGASALVRRRALRELLRRRARPPADGGTPDDVGAARTPTRTPT